MYYRLVYKCNLCGTLFYFGKTFQLEPRELPTLLGKLIKNQMFSSNPALYEAPLFLTHKCEDGSGGLAVFAGFKEVSQNL